MMLRRGLSILLCSCLLAGSLPETGFAAENVQTVSEAGTENTTETETTETTGTVEEPEMTETPVQESTTEKEEAPIETNDEETSQIQETEKTSQTETTGEETIQTQATEEETVRTESSEEEAVTTEEAGETETTGEETEQPETTEEETTEITTESEEEATAVQAVLLEADDNTYVTQMGDYKATIHIKPGYKSADVELKLESSTGGELSEEYWAGIYLKSGGGHSCLLYGENSYNTSVVFSNLEVGTEYELGINLYSHDDIFLGMLAGTEENPLKFTTLESDEPLGPVKIWDVRTDYHSISFKYEKVNTAIRNVVCTTENDKTDEKFEYIKDGAGECTIKGLTPGTTYRLRFSPEDFVTQNVTYLYTYEETITTKKDPYTVEYQIAPRDGNAFKITATVKSSAKAELPEFFMIYWKCYDEDGIPCSCISHAAGSQETVTGWPHTEKTSISDPHMFSSTNYKIKVWLVEADNWDENWAVQTFDVKTNASLNSSDDVHIDVSQDQTNASRAIMKLTVDNYNPVWWNGTYLFYREKGSNDNWQPYPYGTSILLDQADGNMWSGETSIGPLNSGATYEYILNLDGIKIQGTFTFGASGSQVRRDITYDTDAFDTVIAYKLGTYNSNTSYKVTPYYRPHGQAYYVQGWDSASYELTSENGYSADIILKDLMSDSKYDIKLQLEEYGSGGSTQYYADYETITTKKSGLKISNVRPGIDSVVFDAELENVRTEYLLNYLILDPYIKNAAGEYEQCPGNRNQYIVELGKNDGYKATSIVWQSLKENTQYDISLRARPIFSSQYYKEYGTMSFTTLTDDRILEVTEVTSLIDGIKATITLKGADTDSANDSYSLFYKEKDADKEWEVKSLYFGSDTETSYNCFIREYDNKLLLPDTTYIYKLGIGTEIDKLKKVKEGEFKTLKDDRSFEITETTSFVDEIRVTLNFKGTTSDDFCSIFYKEKDAGEDEEWEWTGTYCGTNEIQHEIFVYEGEPLKPDTTYIYKIGMGRKIDDLRKVKEGEFKTLKDDRVVTVDGITEKGKSAIFKISLTGNKAIRTQVNVFYREKGTTGEWEKLWTNIYENEQSIDCEISWYNGEELKEETEYEYVIGIGPAYWGNYTKDDIRVAQEGTFTTRKDSRELSAPMITSGYSHVSVETNLTGNVFEEYTEPCFYYKTQDTSEWEMLWLDPTESATRKFKLGITDLKPATTYDYVLIIGFTEAENLDQLPESKKKTGTFMTKKADYQLSFEVNEAKSNPRKEVLNASAAGTANDAALDIHLTLNTGQSKELRLTEKSGYKSELIFDQLDANTKYTIERADIYVTERICHAEGTEDEWEETYTLQIMSLTPKYEFTTKEAVTPESIRLNKEELKFTLYSEGEYLKPAVSPATASGDVTWGSSNTAVADVDEDGYVSVCGQGEAVVTATSIYDSSVKASAKVSVKNYAVVLNENEAVQNVSVCKGSVDTSIAYAEKQGDTDRWTALTGVTVTSAKPGVADWKAADNGKYGIVGNSVGYTTVTFDRDGYRTTIGVSVYTEAAGFGVTGLQTSSKYPALEKGENTYQIAYSQDLDIPYTTQIAVSPAMDTSNDDFTWTSSNEKAATVYNGRITPAGTGTTTITVKPNPEKKEIAKLPAISFTVEVKALPSAQTPTAYAVTNVDKVLGDVKPGGWEDWTWKNPQTQLYSLPVNDDCYAFEATYTGSRYYAYEGMVNVYISTVTGVSVNEQDTDHRNVVMTGGTDSIKLQVSPVHTGFLPGSEYTVNLPDTEGITVTEGNETGSYTITASRAGSYVLKPEIKIGDKVVATGSYKFRAAADDQISRIEIQAEDNADVTISDGMIYFDTGKDIQTLRLTAKAYNRSGSENTTTKLKWSVTDKTVATIKAPGDRNAEVQVKSSGHTVIQVTSTDLTGTSTSLALEIRDYSPRVEGSKLTINTAYDYAGDDDEGSRITADQYGFVEIIPVYGGSISKVQVVSKNATKENPDIDTTLAAYNYDGHKYIVKPADPDMATGKKEVQLAVTTSAGTVYLYPLTVTIVNKQPKVQFKITKGMNLFYLTEKGRASVTLENSNLFAIERFNWEDGTDAQGFSFRRNEDAEDSRKPNVKVYDISSHNVKMTNGALADSSVANGTVTIKLCGVRKPCTIENTAIKYNYKKPALKTVDMVTKKATSNIIPSMGSDKVMFGIVDSLTKRSLYYAGETDSGYDDSEKDYYNRLECGNADVCLTDMDDMESGYYAGFSYSGSENALSVPLTVDSDYWREPLVVTHKVKAIQPKAVLSSQKLTFNANYTNATDVDIHLKDYSGTVPFTDVVAEGADAKAAGLLADDRLQVTHYGEDCHVGIRLNKLKYMQGETPRGTYTYKLTPYYRSPSTGERTALNTLSLKISFTDQEVTAKASGKGKLDLALSTSDINSIAVTTKFANIGTDYRVTDATLTGDYSKYFDIQTNQYGDNPVYYIRIADSGKGRLKAGTNYNLSVTYTLQSSGGEEFRVRSNVLKVKPVQKVPKITVSGNNPTLYAAAGDMTRSCMIYTPYYTSRNARDYCMIEDAYGSIDVNKDGKADIVVNRSGYYPGGNVYLTIQITDKDAVTASQKGKTYTIPVTVKVAGRDGVSKDASVKIKVKVKR